MSEALCQCGHGEDCPKHREGERWSRPNDCTCPTPPPTREADQKDIANALVGRDPLVAHVLATHMQEGSPEIDPTREPIRLTDEERARIDGACWQGVALPQLFAAVESILAARLAWGPTLADARTPESEDTE